MFRLILVFAFVFAVGLYAWKDWFKSVCGLILLMAVNEHPDMPKSMLGIQGFSPWNILLLNVTLAWFVARRREGLRFDMPRHLLVTLLFLLGTTFVAYVRFIIDPRQLASEGFLGLTSEYLINPFKFVVPGLLLFDGCRSRERFNLAALATVGLYVLLAAQVIRWVPPTTDSEELERRSRKRLRPDVGYHRVDMSSMLAGASWAVLSTAPLWGARFTPLVYGVAGGVVYAQALTAGRTGYVAWAIVGLVLSTLRWRRYLLVAPLAVALLLAFVPSVAERFLEGMDRDEHTLEDQGPDHTAVTGGRNLIWPLVIEKVQEAPLFGRGRLTFIRVFGLVTTESDPEGVTNPHSAYLELLLDTGVVGACLLLSFYGFVLFHALRAFRDSRNPMFIAAGGMATALLLAQLAAGVSAQSFYPREGTVGMWCAIGLLMRIHVERKKAMLAQRHPLPMARVA
jgi:O-antigen ligase